MCYKYTVYIRTYIYIFYILYLYVLILSNAGVPCYIMSHHISWISLGASLCRTRSQPHPVVPPTSPWRWETWPSHRTHRNLELGMRLCEICQEIEPALMTDWDIDDTYNIMTRCDTDIVASTLIGSVLYDSLLSYSTPQYSGDHGQWVHVCRLFKFGYNHLDAAKQTDWTMES